MRSIPMLGYFLGMNDKTASTELKIRVTPALRKRIEAAAENNQRTMNAEVVARLTWAFEHDADGPGAIAKVLGVSSSGDLLEQRVAGLEAAMKRLDPTFGTDGTDEQLVSDALLGHAKKLARE